MVACGCLTLQRNENYMNTSDSMVAHMAATVGTDYSIRLSFYSIQA